MATLILHPISDVSLTHTCSSGSKGYSMISEEVQDEDSTYVYQSLTSTSRVSKSSVFDLGDIFTSSNYHVNTVTMHLYAKDSDDDVISSASVTFKVNEAGSYTVDASSLTTSYSDYSNTNADLVNTINGYLESGVIPSVTATLTTTGNKKDGKSDGYIRVTQIYLEVDYEAISAIYIKESGNWNKYGEVYKKNNGAWVLQSDLASILDTNIKYIKKN